MICFDMSILPPRFGRENPPEKPERRTRGARLRTNRAALVAAPHRPDRIIQGHVSDISREGLRLETARPIPPGTRLEIELYPGADALKDRPACIMGEAVHAALLPSGAYATGVRILLPADAIPEVPSEEAAGEPPRPLPADIRMAPGDQQRTRKASFLWLLTLLPMLLCMLALIIWLRMRPSSIAEPDGVAPASGMADPLEPGLPANAALEEAKDAADDARAPSDVIGAEPDQMSEPGRSADALLARAWDAFTAGLVDNAAALFEQAAAKPEALPQHRALARMGAVQMLAASGRFDAALMELEPLIANPEPLPHRWRQYAESLHDALSGEDRGGAGPALLASVVWLEHVFRATGYGELSAHAEHLNGQGGGGEVIIIDRKQHLLTLYDEDGEPVFEAPVGIGAAGSTPEGRFRVISRIQHPTWWNGKEGVPPGDPQNPLGRYWLGLGGPAGATSYGIHEAQSPADIGAGVSAGCVRMRPNDCQRLFDLAPEGTVVIIE